MDFRPHVKKLNRFIKSFCVFRLYQERALYCWFAKSLNFAKQKATPPTFTLWSNLPYSTGQALPLEGGRCEKIGGRAQKVLDIAI
jgi:hypothetical protein